MPVIRDSYPTPNFAVTTNVTVTFVVPDNANVKALLLGALFTLIQAQNWQKVGTADVETMTQVFNDILASYAEI